MSESLSYRAAKYFGMHEEPRTSILLSEGVVAVIGQRRGRLVLAIYHEHGLDRRGFYTLLSERKRAALVEALSA